VSVFSTDNSGVQSATDPRTITDFSGKVGKLSSIYLQDEWHISTPLTLNYGVRYDKVQAFTNEQQWSPRLNLAYQVDKATAVHAGYSRYFTPPPQELAAQSSIDLFAGTTNAPTIATSNNVKAERTHYFDVGVSHQFSSRLTVNADVYYKRIKNLLDEGQFGQALILSPFNYAKGYAKGLELSAVYSAKNWGGFLNAAFQKAQGTNIISGESLFNADKLAASMANYLYLDHDQTTTLSGGAHYRFGESQISTDALFGSGLRRTPAGGIPNSARLPHYTTVNAAFTHDWVITKERKIEGRISMINLFDKSYLLRDGTGIGVGAPQFGPRRTLYAGISTTF
jgi:outer membrane receptor protein involved in Fe transport